MSPGVEPENSSAGRMMGNIICKALLIVSLAVCAVCGGELLGAENGSQDFWAMHESHSNYITIRTQNGKLYAYIVLLFNENPHFVNIIQEQSIPFDLMQKEGFHLNEYRNYFKTLKDPALHRLVELLLNVYLNPKRFDDKSLKAIQESLERRNIILRFSRDKSTGHERIILDYCIYGTRKPLTITHPLFNAKERIFNIIPYIYYDEFSTSNSTFYFDMIYINPEEVQNDYIIARRVLRGENVDSMFFVGSRVTDDIKFCLLRAFNNVKSIKNEIRKMFEMHELTHKILNNHYNYFDQVMGEEISLSSTIYLNVYLGLSVLYSYLDYNATNPHRIAAMNFVKYASSELGKKELSDNPSLLKNIPPAELQRLSKAHFNSIIKNMK